ncbi:hypothetical protein [Actinomadura harenae]|uniref:hypothetical protein n=1 Tax=Actinomadura harenae TaxID=2483351 RepID=UPI0013158BC3|nr:hypothetical protein [Actinomadura harenae]
MSCGEGSAGGVFSGAGLGEAVGVGAGLDVLEAGKATTVAEQPEARPHSAVDEAPNQAPWPASHSRLRPVVAPQRPALGGRSAAGEDDLAGIGADELTGYVS